MSLNTAIPESKGAVGVQTASLINPIESSALFAHGVPSSRMRNVVPISPQNFLRDLDVCSRDMSHIIASGAPIPSQIA